MGGANSPVDVMSFGGGVQSTAIMSLSGEGLIPMPARWVFSDPGFESQTTYTHLERCKEYLAKKGARLDVVSAGNIRDDAIEFATMTAGGMTKEGAKPKRYASIPMFVQNADGTDGVLPRQCTSEFKIEPIERFHRREVLGLRPRQRAPKEAAVNVWIGISKDEERRASPPGRWRTEELVVGNDLYGDPITKARRMWEPCSWQVKSYPMLGYVLHPDRTKEPDERFAECDGWDRDDAKNWLAKIWPWPVPRSACVCCPYRTNAEWAAMKAAEPNDFARAVEFDHVIRDAYANAQSSRKKLVGVPYLHRTRVPLDMADLSEPLNDRMGCGGLFSQEPDGICGV
jgi:hypothetical protein